MGRSGLVSQGLVFGKVFKAFKCQNGIHPGIVTDRSDHLIKILDNLFSTNATTGFSNNPSSVQNIDNLIPSGSVQCDGDHIGIVTVTAGNGVHIIRGTHNPFGQTKAGGMCQFIARSPHHNRIRFPFNTDRQGLFTDEPVFGRCVVFLIPVQNLMLKKCLQKKSPL